MKQSHIADSVRRGQARAAVPALRALTDGYQFAFAVGAVSCLVGAAAAVTLLRGRRPQIDPAEAEDVDVLVA